MMQKQDFVEANTDFKKSGFRLKCQNEGVLDKIKRKKSRGSKVSKQKKEQRSETSYSEASSITEESKKS